MRCAHCATSTACCSSSTRQGRRGVGRAGRAPWKARSTTLLCPLQQRLRVRRANAPALALILPSLLRPCACRCRAAWGARAPGGRTSSWAAGSPTCCCLPRVSAGAGVRLAASPASRPGAGQGGCTKRLGGLAGPAGPVGKAASQLAVAPLTGFNEAGLYRQHIACAAHHPTNKKYDLKSCAQASPVACPLPVWPAVRSCSRR